MKYNLAEVSGFEPETFDSKSKMIAISPHPNNLVVRGGIEPPTPRFSV